MVSGCEVFFTPADAAALVFASPAFVEAESDAAFVVLRAGDALSFPSADVDLPLAVEVAPEAGLVSVDEVEASNFTWLVAAAAVSDFLGRPRLRLGVSVAASAGLAPDALCGADILSEGADVSLLLAGVGPAPVAEPSDLAWGDRFDEPAEGVASDI